MKTEKNILVAFLLNFCFSVFEVVGGLITGSIAIISDAVHDFGDAVSIGLSCFLEKKSKKQPDATYTYGYARYSVLGSVATTLILLLGSGVVLYNAIVRLLHPAPIDYSGMIVFAVIGVVVNFLAAYFTHEGDSLNQRAVNLHMLEDVLGWAVVLVGAIVMHFTDFAILDAVLSMALSIYIAIHAVKTLLSALKIFLEKIPDDVSLQEVEAHLTEIEGVSGVHHLHIWTLDGQTNYATLHVVTPCDPHQIKHKIREELQSHGIHHATLEIEAENEPCHEMACHVEAAPATHHHHHHH